MSLAPTIRQLVQQAGRPVRDVLVGVARMGFTAVQLDATLSGLRPRELDQRARKDLQALFTRQGMRIAGIDAFIPRSHFLGPTQVDRAMTAAVGAIQLAADLGRVPVSLPLPVKDLQADAKSALVDAADGHGVCLAVHAEDQLEALGEWVADVDLPALKMALDPAALLARGEDPLSVAQSLGSKLAVGRLCDLQSGSDDEKGIGVRCALGEGDLAVDQYRIAMDLCSSRVGPVVLDLRGLTQPGAAAQAAAAVWARATFEV